MARQKRIKRSDHKSEAATYNFMLDRCRNPRSCIWKDYGGRGITVCARWQGYDGFFHFFTDMGPRTSKKHSLDRRDNNGGYWCGKPECPECGPLGREPNCRWATAKEQQRNTRFVHLLTHNGETMCISAWEEKLGLPKNTIPSRLSRGWPVARVFDPPGTQYLKRGRKTKTQPHHSRFLPFTFIA